MYQYALKSYIQGSFSYKKFNQYLSVYSGKYGFNLKLEQYFKTKWADEITEFVYLARNMN